MKCEDIFKKKLKRLIEEPQNHDLYNDIGVMLYELNDYENARKYLCRALELSPVNCDVLYNYAHVLYALLEWRAATLVFIQFLNIKPDDRNAIEKTADAYYQLGEYDLAARYACMLFQ